MLDVTVQAGILHLIRDLADEHNLAVILVTHDRGVMSAVADDVAVMCSGEVIEAGDRVQVFTAHKHDYTKSLLASLPDAQVPFDPRAAEVREAAVMPGESVLAPGVVADRADRGFARFTPRISAWWAMRTSERLAMLLATQLATA